MAERIPPGKVAEWVKGKIEPSLEQSFNAFIQFASDKIPYESPQYTGFYASSWKTSTTRPSPSDLLSPKGGGSGREPWYGIGLRKRRGERVLPHIDPRFDVPQFKLSDTVYIGNTAKYSRYAVVGKVPKTTQYGGLRNFIAGLDGIAQDFFGGPVGLKIGGAQRTTKKGTVTGSQYLGI